MERATRPESGAETARFFQRIFAALIDSFLLVLVFFFGVVATLGWFAPEAILAQTAITFLYFSVFNSGLGGGGTIGKRIMGVRVVNRVGDTISFPLGMWRSIFDMLPSLGAAYLPLLLRNPDLPIPAIGAALGSALVLTNVYLYCCNWKTRQVLHDLMAGTFVVQADTCDRPFGERIWWGHVAFTIVIVAASAYVGTKVTSFQEAVQGRPACVEPATTAVESLPFVRSAWVDRNPWAPAATGDPEHRVVTAFVREGDPPQQARAIARKALAACPAARDDNTLTVLLVPPHKGYSLVPRFGTFPGTVKEWRDSLAYEARAQQKESRCDIAGAVNTLAYVGRTTVADYYAPRDGTTVHVKRVDVLLTTNDVDVTLAGRDVVRKSLAACPGMEDPTVLTVVVTPPDASKASSVMGTVGEWRSSVSFETEHKGRGGEPARRMRLRRDSADFAPPVPNGE